MHFLQTFVLRKLLKHSNKARKYSTKFVQEGSQSYLETWKTWNFANNCSGKGKSLKFNLKHIQPWICLEIKQNISKPGTVYLQYIWPLHTFGKHFNRTIWQNNMSLFTVAELWEPYTYNSKISHLCPMRIWNTKGFIVRDNPI